MMQSILEDKSLLKDRLVKVQTAIRKATDDAWKQSAPSPTSTLLIDNNSSNSNASFLLGMDLFGQDVSILERGIRDKLEDVQDELDKLVAADVAAFVDESMISSSSPENDDDDEASVSSQDLAQQAKIYKQRIQFLKQASLARTALDESTSLSLTALATTTTMTMTDSNEPDLVQASQELTKAMTHVQKAQDYMALEDNNREEQILASIRQGIRRHRVELVHKASHVLDTSIQIHTTTGDTTATTTGGGSLSVKAMSQLQAAYQVLEETSLERGDHHHHHRHLALEESMRRLTQRLYKELLEPVLLQAQQACQFSQPLAPWKIVETANKSKGFVGVTTTSSKGTIHRLEWQRSDDDDETDPTDKATTTTTIQENDNDDDLVIAIWKDTFGLLDRILSFVQSKLLLERPQLVSLVAKRLFGKPNAMPATLKLEALGLESCRLGDDYGLLMELLMQVLQTTLLPFTNEQYQQLLGAVKTEEDSSPSTTLIQKRQQALTDICIPYCRSMASKGMLPDPDQRPKLVAFAQDLQKTFVKHRRSMLLNQARDILMTKTDYHNTVKVGVDISPEKDKELLQVFQLHRCSISETAFQLLQLVRQTMDEAVEAGKSYKDGASALTLLRPTLYRTARDMLHLFRAMIPAAQGSQVRQVPRTAAVLHNDCIYFSQHCLTLGLEYKEKFGPVDEEEDARGKLLRQTCLFVDMVPLFRELADTSLGDMLEVQKHQLAELVGSRVQYFGKSLGYDDVNLHEWSEAETALQAGFYHLSHLSQAWQAVLSKQVYGRCMGYLADVVFALYSQQVLLEATKISLKAQPFVGGLFEKALKDIGTLLQVANPHEVSMEWNKFAALTKCLQFQELQSVQLALSRGVFRSLESQELAKLVQCMESLASQDRSLFLNQLAMAA